MTDRSYYSRRAACRRRRSCSPAAPSSPRPMRSSRGGNARHRHQLPAHWDEDPRLGHRARRCRASPRRSRNTSWKWPGGGSAQPEPDPEAEAVLFVVEGELNAHHRRAKPTRWRRAAMPTSRRARRGRCSNERKAPARFHWIRKAYEAVEGIDAARSLRHQRAGHRAHPMPDTDGAGPRRGSSTRPICATTCTSTSSPSSPAASSRSRKRM